MTRTIVLFACVILGMVGRTVMHRSGEQNASLAQRVRSAILSETTAGFSGSVVVQHRGTTLVQEGFGTLKGVAVAVDTRFWIASIGKQFTSAAILRAQDLGLLDLDDELAHHLSTVPQEKRKITIRQLLSHTSGLPQSYGSESSESRAAAVGAILALPLAAKPGEKFLYSNENFQLAAALIELATKRNYWGTLVSCATSRRTAFTGCAREFVCPGRAHPRRSSRARLVHSD
jgi:CubicO group peptidase (beta-lactamase class C family)